MSYIIVDVESDGPIPAEFSMVCFGAVIFDELLNQTFYGRTRPISERFIADVLAVSGFSRQQHLGFDEPKTVMEHFEEWLDKRSKGRAIFVSDNPHSTGSSSTTIFIVSLDVTRSDSQQGELVTCIRAWSRMRPKRRSGRNTGLPSTLTILWMMQKVMQKH